MDITPLPALNRQSTTYALSAAPSVAA